MREFPIVDKDVLFYIIIFDDIISLNLSKPLTIKNIYSQEGTDFYLDNTEITELFLVLKCRKIAIVTVLLTNYHKNITI